MGRIEDMEALSNKCKVPTNAEHGVTDNGSLELISWIHSCKKDMLSG